MDTVILLYNGTAAGVTALSALVVKSAGLVRAGMGWLVYMVSLPLRLLLSAAATLLAPIWIPIWWVIQTQVWLLSSAWVVVYSLFNLYGPAMVFGGVAGLVLAVIARSALRQGQWISSTPPRAGLGSGQPQLLKLPQQKQQLPLPIRDGKDLGVSETIIAQERRIAKMPTTRKPIKLRGVPSAPEEDWKFLELGAATIDPYSSTSTERDTEKYSLARARSGQLEDSDSSF